MKAQAKMKHNDPVLNKRTITGTHLFMGGRHFLLMDNVEIAESDLYDSYHISGMIEVQPDTVVFLAY